MTKKCPVCGEKEPNVKEVNGKYICLSCGYDGSQQPFIEG